MNTEKKEETREKKGTQKTIAVNRIHLGVAAFVGLLATIYVVIGTFINKPAESHLEAILSKEFVLNRGLCGLYLPGTLIRTRALASDAIEREMATPIIVAWKEDCFPKQQYRQAPFFLPETEGAGVASFSLGMDAVDILLPSLNVHQQTAADYRMRIEGCRLFTMAEVDLAHNFSIIGYRARPIQPVYGER